MKILLKIKKSVKTLFQRLFTAWQLYEKNGLSNHAAACAYGFLFSMVPIFLLIAFLLFITLESSPETIFAMIGTIPILSEIFDESWLLSDFISLSMPGIPSVIYIVSIIWAGRILAQSMQIGLKAIFPSIKSRNPLKTTLITLAIEVSVIIFVLVVIVSSRTALRFYRLLDPFPKLAVVQWFITSQIGGQVFYISLLGIASFFAYTLVPVNPPRKLSALQGALLSTFAYFCTVLVLGIILNSTRYNFLYGTFANLVIILVNVYFFFNYFFFGAQFAYVIDFIKMPPSLRDVIQKKGTRLVSDNQ